MQRHHVSLTTDASGDVTAYTDSAVSGRVVSVLWRPTDLDAGSDLTVTTEATAQTVVVKANVGATAVGLHPRVLENLNTDGSALATHTPVRAATERIKVVVAQGGNAKTGEVIIITEDG